MSSLFHCLRLWFELKIWSCTSACSHPFQLPSLKGGSVGLLRSYLDCMLRNILFFVQISFNMGAALFKEFIASWSLPLTATTSRSLQLIVHLNLLPLPGFAFYFSLSFPGSSLLFQLQGSTAEVIDVKQILLEPIL